MDIFLEYNTSQRIGHQSTFKLIGVIGVIQGKLFNSPSLKGDGNAYHSRL